jgi:hypothetical protein
MDFSLQNLLLPQRKQGEVKDIVLKKYSHKTNSQHQVASNHTITVTLMP